MLSLFRGLFIVLLLTIASAKGQGRKLNKRRMKGSGGGNLGATQAATGPMHTTVCEGRVCRPGEGNLKGYQHWSMPWEPPPIDGLLKMPQSWGRGESFPTSRYTSWVAAAKAQQRDNLVVFAAADFDFRELAENWYAAAQKAGISNAILYALDADAYAHFKRKGLPSYNGTDNLNAWALTRLQRHIQRALAERHMAAAALVDAGLDVLLTDTTHVFLQPVQPFFAAQPKEVDLFAMRGGCNVKEPLGCGFVWSFLYLRGSVPDTERRTRLLQFVNKAIDVGMVDFYLRWWAGHHCIFMGYVKEVKQSLPQLEDPFTRNPSGNAADPNRTAIVSLNKRVWCQVSSGGCLRIGMLPSDQFPSAGMYHGKTHSPKARVGRMARPDLDPKRSHRLRLDRYDEKDFDDLRKAMVNAGLWMLPLSETFPLPTWTAAESAMASAGRRLSSSSTTTKTSSSSLWWVGLLLDAVATLAGCCGKQLLRHAAVSRNCWYYPLGLCLTAIIDPAFDLLAYSFAAQSIIAACAGLVVAWNVLLAPWTLNERLTFSRGIGALLIFAGNVCIGVFGNHNEIDRSPSEYLDLFTRDTALYYYAGYLIWMLTCLVTYKCGSEHLGGFFLCALGGSLAGNSFTTKAAVELTECSVTTAVGCNGITSPLQSPLFFAFAVASLLTASSSLYLLALSLRKFEALYMITVFQGFFVLSGAISGNLVMGEAIGQSAERLVLYAGSVAVVLCGLYVLTAGEIEGLRVGGGHSYSSTYAPPTRKPGTRFEFGKMQLT